MLQSDIALDDEVGQVIRLPRIRGRFDIHQLRRQPDLADSPSFSGFGAASPFVTICFVNPAAQQIGEKWL